MFLPQRFLSVASLNSRNFSVSATSFLGARGGEEYKEDDDDEDGDGKEEYDKCSSANRRKSPIM